MPHATQTISLQLAPTLFHVRAAASKSDVLGADAPGALRDCAASPSALRLREMNESVIVHTASFTEQYPILARGTRRKFFLCRHCGVSVPEFLSISRRKIFRVLWNTDPIVPA